jgi:hypothetical protein
VYYAEDTKCVLYKDGCIANYDLPEGLTNVALYSRSGYKLPEIPPEQLKCTHKWESNARANQVWACEFDYRTEYRCNGKYHNAIAADSGCGSEFDALTKVDHGIVVAVVEEAPSDTNVYGTLAMTPAEVCAQHCYDRDCINFVL